MAVPEMTTSRAGIDVGTFVIAVLCDRRSIGGRKRSNAGASRRLLKRTRCANSFVDLSCEGKGNERDCFTTHHLGRLAPCASSSTGSRLICLCPAEESQSVAHVPMLIRDLIST